MPNIEKNDAPTLETGTTKTMPKSVQDAANDLESSGKNCTMPFSFYWPTSVRTRIVDI